MDWTATSADYDYATDTGASHPIGYGATQQEAIADYLELIREDVP